MMVGLSVIGENNCVLLRRLWKKSGKYCPLTEKGLSGSRHHTFPLLSGAGHVNSCKKNRGGSAPCPHQGSALGPARALPLDPPGLCPWTRQGCALGTGKKPVLFLPTVEPRYRTRYIPARPRYCAICLHGTERDLKVDD
jgi:hypothetical protein